MMTIWITMAAVALVFVANMTKIRIVRNIALVGAALIGAAIALKIFIHAITWAIGALFGIALICTLAWFAIRNSR